jgi:hypothetical protein
VADFAVIERKPQSSVAAAFSPKAEKIKNIRRGSY